MARDKYLEELKNMEEIDVMIEHTLNDMNNTSSDKKIEAPEKYFKPCNENLEFTGEDAGVYEPINNDCIEDHEVPDGAAPIGITDDIISSQGYMYCCNCVSFNPDKNRCMKYHIPVSAKGVCDFFQMSEEVIKKLINYREEI